MQTSATTAQSVNPFAAAQAGGQAVGELDGLLEGLFGGGEDGTETAATDAFSEALAAALLMPTQAQPILAAPVAKTGDASAPAIAPAAAQGFMLTPPVLAAEDVSAIAPGGVEGEAVSPDAAPQAATSRTAETANPDLQLAFAAAKDSVAPPVPQPPLATPNPPPAAAVVDPAVIAQTATVASAAKTETPPTAQAEAVAPVAAAPRTAPTDPHARTAKAKSTAPAGETRGEPKTAALPTAATPVDAANTAAAPHDGAEADLASLADANGDPDADADAPAFQAAHHEVKASTAPAIDTPRATTQTVAHLAAQITSKIDGKSTRFDVQLDPHGLGKVDVKVEIAANGSVSAALTFENPQSAAELRGRQGELQAALEQAGFDLSKTSLSFSSGGQGQQGLFDQQQQHHAQAPVWRGRAFTDLSDTPETAPAPVRRAATGVDVRI